VQRGVAVCPVAHPVLEETCKQQDPTTRAATANVIDRLSLNVAIEPFPVLDHMELLHFVRTATKRFDFVPPANEMAWTWPCWILGVAKPASAQLDRATNNALAKAFFDLVTHLPFSHLVQSGLDAATPLSLYDTEESQRAKTQETRRHRHEFTTFQDVFLIEVAGIIDVLKPRLEAPIIDLYERSIGRRPTPEQVRASRLSRPNMADLIYSAFKHDKVGEGLPGVRILAGLHAAIRYRDQPHRKGDLHDHMHARIALPYCNIFLTERNLGTLLTQPPLQYAQLYRCRVMWEDAEILAALTEL
jgi:hypothetical protein